MKRITSILIHRAEGYSHECKPQTFYSWSDAEDFLRRSAYTAPKNGGYDKCDVAVTFEDGFVYRTRYDLSHHDTGNFERLASIIGRQWEFYAGRWLPARFTEEQWQRYVDGLQINPGEWAARCDAYEIPGVTPRVTLASSTEVEL